MKTRLQESNNSDVLHKQKKHATCVDAPNQYYFASWHDIYTFGEINDEYSYHVSYPSIINDSTDTWVLLIWLFRLVFIMLPHECCKHQVSPMSPGSWYWTKKTWKFLPDSRGHGSKSPCVGVEEGGTTGMLWWFHDKTGSTIRTNRYMGKSTKIDRLQVPWWCRVSNIFSRCFRWLWQTR